MELVIDQPHLVDTLRFQLHASRALPQMDIRVTVAVEALVPSTGTDRAVLEQRIRAALAKLADTAWTFTRIERAEDTAGYQRISLRASARLPALENWNLAERARSASGEGIALADPEVSYALSPERVGEVVADLRAHLYALATKQAADFSASSGRAWRVGDIEFGSAALARERARRTGKGAYTDDDSSIELAAISEGPAGISGGERVTLYAAVVLKAAGLAAAGGAA